VHGVGERQWVGGARGRGEAMGRGARGRGEAMGRGCTG